MSEPITITVNADDLAAIARRLEEFSDREGRRIMLGAVRAGAVAMRKEAKQAAPVRGSGGVRRVGRKGGPVRAPGFLQRQVQYRRVRATPFSYAIGPSGKAFYGKFLEFGRKGGPSRGSRTKKARKLKLKPRMVPPMTARPWLGPAWRRSGVRVFAAIVAAYSRLFEREARRRAG